VSGLNVRRLKRLRPEEKVDVAIHMSDVCVRICAEGIRAQFPDITEQELIERLRERIEWSKRWCKRGHEV
jgi:hypothetical protein